MAIRPIGIEDFDHMGIDPQTLKLYWDNQEVVTTLALPWAVNVASVTIAVVAVLGLVWSITRFFLERGERRAASRGTSEG
jgi:hypothetical protein